MEIPFDNYFPADVKSNAFRLLDEIREPIWTRIIENCCTFVNRTCNAEFSQIFSSKLFENLTEGERKVFEISYEVRGTCSNCGNEKKHKSANVATLISHFLYPELMIDANAWPNCVTNSLNLSTDLFCDSCSAVNIPTEFQSVNLPCFLLIEFCTALCIEKCKFFEQILVKDSTYKLKAVVRNCGLHFACGLFIDNVWVYIDDLNPEKIIYQNLNDMLSENRGGWFFAFYRKADEEVDFLIHDATVTTNSNAKRTDDLENIQINEIKKEYPNRKRKLVNYEGLCSKNNKKIKLDDLFKKIDKKLQKNKRKARYDSEKQKAIYDSEKRKANYDPEKQKANYDPEKRKTYYDPEKQKDNYDPEKQKANYDSEKRKAYYDPKKQKVNYDPEKQKASYNPEKRKGKYDSEQRKKRYNLEKQKKNLKSQPEQIELNNNNNRGFLSTYKW